MGTECAQHLFYRIFDFQFDFPDIYQAHQQALDTISLECLLKILFPNTPRENILHKTINLLQQSEKEVQEYFNSLDNME